MVMSLSNSEKQANRAGQASYGMSNLRPTFTGLTFIVFISQKDDARDAARVKWSRGPKVVQSDMGSYAIFAFGHKAGPRLDRNKEQALERWISLNRDVLQKYWDGDIAYTQDAIEQLKPI